MSEPPQFGFGSEQKHGAGGNFCVARATNRQGVLPRRQSLLAPRSRPSPPKKRSTSPRTPSLQHPSAAAPGYNPPTVDSDREHSQAGADSTGTASSESTISLLQRAQRGDEAALEQLVARHLTPLRRWARGRLPVWARDAEDTDDLVQDVLLKTFRRLDHIDLRGPGALLAYLRQSVLNRVRNELRNKGRRPEVGELDGFEVDPSMSPLEATIGREAVERYEQALARLRVDEREAIIGRVEMGYSYDELAEALGKPSADAARKAARRALIRLSQEMNRTGP